MDQYGHSFTSGTKYLLILANMWWPVRQDPFVIVVIAQL